MQLTEQEKKDILDCVLTTVSHICDKNYQKKIWIQGEGPEVDDFDETICHFFQEGDGVIEKYKDFGLTDIQVDLLRKFREEFKEFSDKHDLPQLFIDTLEWTEITIMAKEVLYAFGYHKPKILKIKLSKPEFIYLCKAAFMQKKHREALLSAQQISDAHLINISEDQAIEIRDLCGEQLQIVGFDKKYELTPEGEILESLIDKFVVG